MYVFEDSAKAPISNMLSISENCIFAGSNTKVAMCAKDFGEKCTCLVDVPLDSPRLIEYYNALLSEFMDTDVEIIPIPCIEYFALLCISRYQIEPLPKDFVETALYLSYGLGSSVKMYSDRTFERYCKHVLSSRRNKCLINKVSNKFGVFYVDDCHTGHGICGVDLYITIRDKSISMWEEIHHYIETVCEFQARFYKYVRGEL